MLFLTESWISGHKFVKYPLVDNTDIVDIQGTPVKTRPCSGNINTMSAMDDSDQWRWWSKLRVNTSKFNMHVNQCMYIDHILIIVCLHNESDSNKIKFLYCLCWFLC